MNPNDPNPLNAAPPTGMATADPNTGINPPAPTWSAPAGATPPPTDPFSNSPLAPVATTQAVPSTTPTTPPATPAPEWPATAPETPIAAAAAPTDPLALATPAAPDPGLGQPSPGWPQQPVVAQATPDVSAAAPAEPLGAQPAAGGAEATFNWSTPTTPTAPQEPTAALDQPVITGLSAATEETSSTSEPGLPSIDTTEPAPTDLSQLSNMSTDSPTLPPPIPTPETGAVPPQPATAEATVIHDHKFPVGLIIAGVIILLLVVTASAYFILGIGKPSSSQTPTSLPANTTSQAPLTNPPKPLVPTTPTPATPSGAQSGTGGNTNGFETLTGSTANNPSASSSPKSAIELLQQRNSQSNTGTSSATPQ